MSSLGSSEKRLLLALARRALTLAVQNCAFLEEFPDVEALQQPGGAFVTLHHGKRLRGCVGQLPSKDSLAEVVAHCAKSAALEDPRFEPVRAEELREIEIELSVLSPSFQIAPERIETGKHGLMVSSGLRRGVLLPQVAVECHWTAERFLEQTCIKAGLAGDAWRDRETRIEAFTAEVFAESDSRSGQLPGPADRARPPYS